MQIISILITKSSDRSANKKLRLLLKSLIAIKMEITQKDV